MQRIAAQMIGPLRIGPAIEQSLDQGDVSGRRCRDQRRLVHRRAVVDPVALAGLQDVLEARREISDVVLAPQAASLPGEVLAAAEARIGHQHSASAGSS